MKQVAESGMIALKQQEAAVKSETREKTLGRPRKRAQRRIGKSIAVRTFAGYIFSVGIKRFEHDKTSCRMYASVVLRSAYGLRPARTETERKRGRVFTAVLQ